MSAFAVIYERSNTPVELGVFNRVMERLAHRGPDGSDFVSVGSLAMGRWHFWTTPEEVNERQPLELNGLPFKIVLDGRLDNRAALFEELGISRVAERDLSDAALILRAYARWGENCFERLVGEFALVIFDGQKNELICARDHLGDRALFYAFYGARLIVASEPWAVAGGLDTPPAINEYAVAHYFALKIPENGQTLFNGVYELQPASTLTVTPAAQRVRRYWEADPSKKIRYKTDEEYAEHFRSLLEESVRCRLRSTAPAGVLMSGGLDSTSVACLAARMVAPRRLTTVSYVFDELLDCDERRYVNAVTEQWRTRSIQIPCDDAWTYKDWQNWRRNPNLPEGNMYRLVKERAYQRARDEGLRVLLTGGFGDQLYDGAEEWMSDLFADGKPRQALREFSENIRSYGLRKSLAARSFRRLARHALEKIPGGKFLRAKQAPSPWLTSYSNDIVNSEPSAWMNPAFSLKNNLLGLRSAQNPYETYNVSQYALELRHPYRDRRLIEFALALPAYQLYFHGVYKYILRIAMKGILPEAIRARREPTSLAPLYFRGVEREKVFLQDLVQDANASWRKFVQADWLLKHWDAPAARNRDGLEALVPWLCFSYSAW